MNDIRIITFQCPICGRTFSKKSNEQKHLLSHKVWPEGITRTIPENGSIGYACTYCSTVLSSHPKLRSHMKQHAQRKVFACIQPDCREHFDNLTLLLTHVNNDHPNPIYRCYVCSDVYSNLSDFAQHQMNHDSTNNTKKDVYLCEICKAQFSSYEKLCHHMNITSHEYSCTKCEKKFASERSLRRHLSTHLEAIYTCSICSKSFRTQQYLKSHIVTHSANKPYSCDICYVSFNRKDRLIRHSKLHDAAKKIKCPLASVLGCKKEYYRNDKLKSHLITHTKDKKKKNVKTLQVLILSIGDKN